ncbi:MAG: HTH domain-containing protein, partial [Butyrivibrio sp.]|nr:HTH domain-containing protein [Butyrivibrio sp.]
MSGNERRNKIIEMLRTTAIPLSGSQLSKLLGVSRQVIVTDIA